MKLKTLKDFKEETIIFDDGIDKFEFPVIDKIELKQEAIKWIEQLRLKTVNGCFGKTDFSYPFTDDDRKIAGAIIYFIKYFFNIKEGDLK